MTPAPKPDFNLNLIWQGGQRFSGNADGNVSITIDGRR